MKTRRALLLAWLLLASCAGSRDPDDSTNGEPRLVLFVAAGATEGDGSAAHPFGDIQSAVDLAQARGGGLIHVRPGSYIVNDPIRITGDSVWLDGSGEPQCKRNLDDASELPVPCAGDDDPALHPTGEMAPGSETVIESGSGLISSADPPEEPPFRGLVKAGCNELFDGACPGAQVISNVRIRGFTLRPNTRYLNAISTARVQDLQIEDNVIRGPGFMGAQLIASSGRFVRNYATGTTGGIIVFGGYPDSPADFDVAGNTFQATLTEGAMLVGSSTGLAQLGDRLVARVRNNLIDRTYWGIRVIPQMRPKSWPGDEQVSGQVTAQLSGNRLQGNDIAYQIDAGFSYRLDVSGGATTPFVWDDTSQCAPRWFSGRLEVAMEGETLVDNGTDADISFGRPEDEGWGNWQYLHHGRYVVTDKDLNLIDAAGKLSAKVQVDHPQYDPYQDLDAANPPELDACRDQRQYDYEGGPRLHPDTPLVDGPGVGLELALGNSLAINGHPIAYVRSREHGVSCSGSPPVCQLACADGVDNDADGVSDASDPECAAATTCDDQVDNDGDGSADSLDSSCHRTCGEALGSAIACTSAPPPTPFPPADGVDPVVYCLAYLTPLEICDADSMEPSEWLASSTRRLSGGPGTQAYYAVIDCARDSGCAPGDVACIGSMCGPAIGACQQTPCQEQP